MKRNTTAGLLGMTLCVAILGSAIGCTKNPVSEVAAGPPAESASSVAGAKDPVTPSTSAAIQPTDVATMEVSQQATDADDKQTATTTQGAEKKTPAKSKAQNKDQKESSNQTNSAPGNKTAPQPVKPATVGEIVKALDLTSLPKLNEVTVFENKPTKVSYEAKGKIGSAAAYYRAELADRDWKEIGPSPSATSQYLDTVFQKNGFYLKMSVSESKPGETVSVDLDALGNVDVRNLPAPEGGESQNSGVPTSASYLFNSDLETVTKSQQEILQNNGWRPYRTSAAQRNPEGSGFYFQNGVMLYSYVSASAQFQNGKPISGYALTGTLPIDFPVIDDATEIQLVGLMEEFEYVTNSDLAKITKFYNSAYEELGWKPIADQTHLADDSAALTFEANEDLRAIVVINPREEGGMKVYMKRAPSAKQLAELAASETPEPTELAPTDEPAPSDEPTTEDNPTADNSDQNPDISDLLRGAIEAAGDDVKKALQDDDVKKALGEAGIEVPDGDADKSEDAEQPSEGSPLRALPKPDDAQSVEYDKDTVDFESSTSVPKLREFYKEELTAKGWKEDESDRFGNDSLYSTTYQKDELTLDLTLQRLGKHTDVTLEIDGLESEETPEVTETPDSPADAPKLGAAMKAEDFPVPEDAKNVERDAGRQRITFRCKGDGDTLDEFFTGALEGHDWFKSSTIGSGGFSGTTTTLGFDREGRSIKVKIDTKEGEPLASVVVSGNGLQFGEQAPKENQDEEIEVEEKNGLPVPSNHANYQATSSAYRATIEVHIPGKLADIVAFYKRELAAREWKEVESNTKVTEENASMSFTQNGNQLQFSARPDGNEVVVELLKRDADAAKRDGMLPQEGKARLVIGNASGKDVTIVINGRPYKVKAGVGAEDPKKAMTMHVVPGKYRYTIEGSDNTEPETINLTAGTTWGIVILPDAGHFSEALY